MNIGNAAKEVARIASTHGLSKDVIDLLTTKVSLIEEKLLDTTSRLEQATVRIGELESKNQHLQAQLKDAIPHQNSLAEPQQKILKLLHESKTLSVEQLAGAIILTAPDTKFHLDQLKEAEFVELDLGKSMNANRTVRTNRLHSSRSGRVSSTKSLGFYYIKPKGREYVVTNNL